MLTHKRTTMKFNHSSRVIVVIVLLLSSCTTDDGPADPNASTEKDNNGVWYLKRNATFTYSLSSYDTTGNTISTIVVVNTINTDSLMDDVTWYKISDSPIHYYRNRSDGLYRMEVRSGVVTGPYVLLKYPTSLNAKYRSDGDSVIVDEYVPSSLTNEVTITYRFTKNGKTKLVQRITTGSCPSAIDVYGTTVSGRQYVQSSMRLQEAHWP